MSYTIVIGAGLFGQQIARALKKQGRKVLLLDSKQPHAGSPPAACLIRREWCGKLPEGVYDDAMVQLEHSYTLHQRVLWKPDGKPVDCHWFDPKELLAEEVTPFEVMGIDHNGIWGNSRFGVHGRWLNDNGIGSDTLGADMVVVAAGAWSQKLVEEDLGLTGKAGVAWLYKDVDQPGLLHPWAPYRQIVGFDRGDGYWISDGSAIKHENFSLERRLESYNRCRVAVHREAYKSLVYRELYGIRPYTKEQPCVCRQVVPGLWVAVGARKNGTLLGAWCARKIAKESQ